MNITNIDIIEEKRREERRMKINNIGNDGISVRSKMMAASLFHTKREIEWEN